MLARPSLWQKLRIWENRVVAGDPRKTVCPLAILCPDMLRQNLASPSVPEESLDLLMLEIRLECACLASLGLCDSQELTVLGSVSLRIGVIFLAY